MTADVDELRAYYEEEARRRSRVSLVGRRVQARRGFIERLERQGRRSVLDVGAGPGLDGEAFVAAGFDYLGVDLAHRNCLVAAARSVPVVQGLAGRLPIRAASFDAGWSMSVLMHLDEDEAVGALRGLAEALRPGSPCVIGLWGGDGQAVDDTSIPGERRRFRLRPVERNRQLMAECGVVERVEVWEPTDGGWSYQLFRLTSRG